MLLFLTREAFCRRSMDDRRVGDGEPERDSPKTLFSALNLFCQKSRGDVVVVASSGEDWKGEESELGTIFWVREASQMCRQARRQRMRREMQEDER